MLQFQVVTAAEPIGRGSHHFRAMAGAAFSDAGYNDCRINFLIAEGGHDVSPPQPL
jgi:hypothetical protein